MALSRILVAWMVFWLAANGALAAVMPYCQHALQSSPDRGAHAGHQMQDAEVVTATAHEHHASHGNPPASHDAHSGIACDDCGACHLIGSGLPPTPMLASIGEFAAAAQVFVADPFRGHIPEQPFHPPRPSRTA